MIPLIIIGAGGHAKSVIAALEKSDWPIAGVIADPIPHGVHFQGVPVLGPIPPPSAYNQNHNFSLFIAIGENSVRERIAQEFAGSMFPNVIHPRAQASLQHCGTFVGCDAYIGPSAFIGEFCIINTKSIVEHDAMISDFVNLCPGVIVGGNASIGAGTFVGMGAIIRNRVKIGTNCIIGMGSVVTKDMPNNCVAWGNPCRVVNHDLR